MQDTREAILSQIRALLDTIPGVATGPNGMITGTGRNRDHISAGPARPMIILYDGTEEIEDMVNASKRSGVQIMRMSPDITVFIGDTTENLGPRFSSFRAALITTILNDPALQGLTNTQPNYGLGGGTNMRYDGCDFNSETGEQREGSMTLHMRFWYAFRLADLAA